jgi:hypothetical protein
MWPGRHKTFRDVTLLTEGLHKLFFSVAQPYSQSRRSPEFAHLPNVTARAALQVVYRADDMSARLPNQLRQEWQVTPSQVV